MNKNELFTATDIKIVHNEAIPDLCPLTAAQLGVYMECMESPETLKYNLPAYVCLPENTDIERYIDSVRKVVAKHPAFYVTAQIVDGVPCMRYQKNAVTVNEVEAASLEEELERFVRPFDLENGPLYRFEICRYQGKAAFLFDVHHMIFDGTSMKIFVDQIEKVYEGSDIPSETLTVFDISEYEKSFKTSARYKKAQEFFAARLKGSAAQSIPYTDRPGGEKLTGSGSVSMKSCGIFNTDDVSGFIKSHGITENTLFLGAFAYAMKVFAGSEDICFTTVSNGRYNGKDDRRLLESLGMFVKTLPLCFSVSDRDEVPAFLTNVQKEFYETRENDCIYLGELAAAYDVNMDVSFAYQADLYDAMTRVHKGDSVSAVDIDLYREGTSYRVAFRYDRNRYSATYIESFAETYMQIIAGMLSCSRLADIPLVSDKSLAITEQINDTDYPVTPVAAHVLVEKQAATHPEKTAVTAAGEHITYGELNALADRIAGSLCALGLKREGIVGTVLPRRKEAMIAELAVWKASGAFLPMTPSYPDDRIMYCLEDSKAQFVITNEEIKNERPDVFGENRTYKTLTIEDLLKSEASFESIEVDPAQLAYCIYTSGSTGKPKGVMIEHRNLCNFVDANDKNDETRNIVQNGSTMLSVAALSFDFSILETWLPLCNGLSVCIATDEEIHDPIALASLIKKENVDLMAGTPSFVMGIVDIEEVADALKNINCYDFGAEAFSGALYEKLTSIRSDAVIINGYGPTEATVSCISKLITGSEHITIGKPASNVRTYIMDKEKRLLPTGAPGELIIAGDGVGRGYINLPEKTAESFFTLNGKRAYHSGDFCRLNTEGEIEFFGRLDNQVKLRGLRVELDEIENNVLTVSDIKNVKVVVRHSGTEDFLALFYTAGRKIDPEEIHEKLKESLPAYMIPSVMMQLEKMPLNTNGKIDKNALPEVTYTAKELTAPENDCQQQIFDIVADVLGHVNFGVDTDMYEAGLASIGAIRLTALLDKKFGIPFSISTIKDCETVRALEAYILKAPASKSYALQDDYPLTRTQEGIAVECITNPGTTIYNIPSVIRMESGVDAQRLVEALKATVNAHPYLKTRLFTNENGKIRAKRLDDSEPNIAYIEGEEPVIEELVRPFDLFADELYRLKVYHNANGCALFADFHHIVFDGTSESIFFRDLDKAYAGEKLAKENYTGFEAALDEENARETDAFKKAEDYYHKIFDDCDTDNLPPSDPELTEAGLGSVRLDLSLSSEELAKACKKYGVSESAFFNSAFGYALCRLSGKDDTVYTTVYNGRSDSRKENSVSMYVKTLPVRCIFGKDMRVSECIQSIGKQILDSMSNDIYSFADISDTFGIRSDVMFVYQGEDFDPETLCGVSYNLQSLASDTSKAALLLQVFPKESGYTINAEFNKEMYGEDMVFCMLECVAQTMKEFAVKDALCDINLVSPRQKELLDSFNRTDAAFEIDKTVIDMFRQTAAQIPDSTAVVYRENTYSYSDTDRISDSIAVYLSENGIGRGDVVSVLIGRSEYMPIASLGVLKTGAAYLPLDPSYPEERLNFMVQDCAAKLLITDEELADKLSEWNGNVLYTKDIPALPAASEEKQSMILRAAPRPEDLFILLYTSGSTGTPKGVMLTHKNIAAFCTWYRGYFELDKSCAVAAYASYGFDACMMDMYPTLTSGAQLHIIAEEIRLDMNAIETYFNENKITHSFMTTQVGRNFAIACEPKYLKHLSMGGEKLVPFDPGKNFTIHNLYGPTECTVFITQHDVKKLYKRVPIGKQLSNLKLYVTDEAGARLPIGVPGELCAAGYQVSAGYLNRPEKMAEVYIANPFDSEKGYETMYRTGDIVRLLPDGTVDFIGRNDGQVKVRGFRIELTEVEEVIRRFKGITDATVVAFETPSGGKEIAAYVVSEEKVDLNGLRGFIRAEKPAYMVPSAIMQIDSIPLNQNQKVNKKALPKPELGASESENTGVKAGVLTECEKRILAILDDTTGIKTTDVTTELVGLGVTSISAISFVTVLAKKYGVDIQVTKILEGASVLDIENEIVLSLLEGMEGKKTVSEKSHEVRDAYPLTQTQLGVYYETMQQPDSTLYNIPVCLKFSEIDSDRLSKAIKAAVKAHSFLNTHIETGKTGFMQVRNDDAEADVAISDLGDMSIQEVFRNFEQPFRLHVGPLYRFEIVKAPDCLYLMMDFHHIVFDGFSINLFMDSVKQAYETGRAEKEEYTYFDYSLDEDEFRQGEEYAASEKYFKNILSDFENTTEVPADISGRADDGKGASVSEFMDKAAVENFCKENRITPSTLFLASVFYTVSRFASTNDVYITTISNGRANAKTREAIGMFVRTLPIAMRPKDSMSVADYIEAAGDAMNGSIANERYPFTEIAAKYGYATDVMYECQLGVVSGMEIDGHTAENIADEDDTVKFKLKIAIFDSDEGICLGIGYNDALYSEKYMQLFARSLKICTERMMADTSASIKKLSLLSDEDAKKLERFSQTEAGEIPCEGLVHRMFEAQAAKNPNKTAVIACDASLSYAELDRQANIIANNLIAKGIGRGDMVVLLLPRRSYYFASLLGVLKTGAAFIPCDPKYPSERINLITEDSGAQFIVTTEDKLAQYSDGKAIDIAQLLTGDNTANPQTDMASEDLAYAIYTSGSTGKPKGVLIRHIGVCSYFTDSPSNILYRKANELGVEKILCITTVSFDLSMKDSVGMLCNGKTLVFANEEQMNDPMELASLIGKYDIHLFNGTPSRLQQYLEYLPFAERLKSMKVIACGGEPYPAALIDHLNKLTDATLINTYGPTEITISCNMADLTHSDHVTVGRPLYNYREFIVDSDENLLPPGIVGELYVGGPGVAKGYQNLDELTRKAFVEYNGIRVYKTGDYAKWDADGSVIILGRKDNQVKLRGLRIELGEIESLIAQQPSIKQALVLIRKLNGQDNLCAYYTASEKLDAVKLRDALKTKLTHYMVPTAYLQLDAFPVNANGKTDRKALPDPVPIRNGEFVEASGETERFFCDIFAKTLKMDKVGAEDDFFECGGSSLTATSIVVAAVEKGYSLSYSDVFSNPTPRALAELITGEKQSNRDSEIEDFDYTAINELLSHNTLEAFRNGEEREIGNILLTGTTGYMGIHVLFNFLKNESGKAYCMLRRGKSKTAMRRLEYMMFYYFGNEGIEMLGDRVEVLEGDVTKYEDFERFEKYDINTVFNCAANVKHFSAGTDIEDINIGGAENCITFCSKTGARLIHFSTTSTGGEIIVRDNEDVPVFDEHTLYIGQKLNNKYSHSKFIAERKVLSAVINGLDAKVIRVGTLSPRASDGEFQINFLTNSFMERLRTYTLLGIFPYSLCQDVIRMGAIDVSVDAFMKLARTPSECCLFNACNNHIIFLADIIACLRKRGKDIRFVEDDVFNTEIIKAGEDPAKAAIISSLLAYVHADQDERLRGVDASCTYTSEILNRMDFLWNVTDKEYVEKFLTTLDGMFFFDTENLVR